ncbi:hypothetical protein G8E10_09530 [Rhizobiaceae bacterium CRRU44]|uniref:Terminase small subunit n=1 Tax=Ferranicluibacter rubi TaxID=2715133 RepID=A0AA44CAK6_9HYPH|nr:hypothetical protein [Ferranicluibacter rubi]NHT75919.1 hypothetical protein [Ferranicluibacter rubi]NHT75979.1 hypothetical protein [Ferranicluibacter rubi]
MAMPLKTSAAYKLPAQKAAAALRKENKEPLLTEKQKALVHAMVFEGNSRKEAAEAADLTDKAAREALIKPNVLAYLNECMEVLRTSARPRALHRMVDLLDAKTERIQFESAKYLDGMDRPSHAVGATQINVQVNTTTNVTPGYMVKLDRSGGAQIEHLAKGEGKALPHMQDVPEDD